jgi:predicted amidohydrolase
MKYFYLFSFFITIVSADIKVASLNYKITGNKDLKSLLQEIDQWAFKAHKSQAKYLLLPELMTFDLLPVNPEDLKLPSLLKNIALLSEDYEKGLEDIASKNEIILIGASTLIPSANEGFINRAYMIKPKQKAVYQDKNYPTPWELKQKVQRTSEIKLFKGDDFNFVILICYDAEFPSISMKLTELMPEVVFVPSQTDDEWGLERVKRTSAARSIEHMAYVLMTGISGEKNAPWHSYVGRNYVFAPQNKIMNTPDYMGKNQMELSIISLNLDLLRKSRSDKSQIYPARDELFGQR